MDKTKVAYTIGRFQPPTIGHRMLIDKTIASGDKAYVFVSAVEPDNKKNPLDAELKLPILRKMFEKEVAEKKVQFIHTKKDCLPRYKNCGGPGPAFTWLTDKVNGPGYDPSEVTIVLGKERLGEDKKSKQYFGPEATFWGETKPVNFVSVGNGEVRDLTTPSDDVMNMSGTKARGYVKEDNSRKRDFYIALGYDPNTQNQDVDNVYDRIYQVKFGGRKGGDAPENEVIPLGGPDGEPASGGRRKTRRLKKNKASGKVLYRRGLRSRTGSLRTSRS